MLRAPQETPRSPTGAQGGPLEALGGPSRSSRRLRLRVLRKRLRMALFPCLESYLLYWQRTPMSLHASLSPHSGQLTTRLRLTLRLV